MRVLVFTTVYPNEKQPNLGVFVRERMSRVAKLCDIKVLAPVPYFPLAGLFKEKYRHRIPRIEYQESIEVHHPRFFLIPGVMKLFDGFFLYLSTVRTVREIQKNFDFDLIDAHFAFPDGFAAVLLGRHFRKPVTITLRGTLNRLVNYKGRRAAIRFALNQADKVFSVSAYLVKLARSLGINDSKFEVIPNGVDIRKFRVLDKFQCRQQLGIPKDRKVIISVGALVERKGHHRVIEILPEVIKKRPNLLYLVVGGPSVEGDISDTLKKQIDSLNLSQYVHLAGTIPHDKVNQFLCASDVFTLATRYEGWANVFFEAMACGLPVVTTDVCGNSEVVNDGENGLLVPFGNREALAAAIDRALKRKWDREAIIQYARSRTWEKVADEVYKQFQEILSSKSASDTSRGEASVMSTL